MKNGLLATIAWGLLSAAPLSALTRTDKADKVIQPGIYGNVRMSAATGDLGGIEVEVQEGVAHILDITICEGWCNSIYTVVYEDEGDWIAFQVEERVDQVRKFRIRQRGQEAIIEEDKEFSVFKARLKRQKDRFGLDVAKDSMSEYEKVQREGATKTPD